MQQQKSQFWPFHRDPPCVRHACAAHRHWLKILLRCIYIGPSTMTGEGSSRAYRTWGFDSVAEYGRGLKNLPSILWHRSFSPMLPADALVESGAELRRVLVSVLCNERQRGARAAAHHRRPRGAQRSAQRAVCVSTQQWGVATCARGPAQPNNANTSSRRTHAYTRAGSTCAASALA